MSSAAARSTPSSTASARSRRRSRLSCRTARSGTLVRASPSSVSAFAMSGRSGRSAASMKATSPRLTCNGDIDIEGDMLKPFALRASLDDRHPLVAAWRFIEPLLFGQVYTNKRAIASHYNADPKLFLSFLDPVFPAYSQGVYANDDEPLAKALERKFDWAIEQCELGPGKTVLEIGPGWGAFASHALAVRRAASPASPTRKCRNLISDRSSPISATASTSCSPISSTTSRRSRSTPSSSWASSSICPITSAC